MACRNFSLDDVKFLFRSGVIRREPEYDVKRGEWAYRIEGKSLDDEPMYAAFSFKFCWSVTVITVSFND
jgi:hypothetical protein